MSSRAWHTLVILGFTLATGFANAATPCPPPQVAVEGGNSVSTTCQMVSSNALYSTNFPATENPLSEGGKWVGGKVVGLDWNNPETTSGKAFASINSGINGASRYNDSIAIINKSVATFNANQYAQGTVFKVSGYSAAHEVELLLHFSISAHDAHGYEILWGAPGYLAVVRWNGPLGNYTTLYDSGVGGIAVPQEGDVLRAEMNASVITVKLNGKQVARVDVTSAGNVWATGQPGVGFWPVDGAVRQNYGWKAFEAGNL